MTRNPTPEPVITARDVANGAGTTLLARLGGVFEVIAQPAYVAMFGLAGYGLYTVLWAAVNITENVLDLGMAAGLQRVIPQSKTPEDEVAALRAAFLIGLIPCIAAAVLASLGASYLASLVNAADADAARVALAIGRFSWSLPLWCFIEISTSALRSKRLFGAEIRLRYLDTAARRGLRDRSNGSPAAIFSTVAIEAKPEAGDQASTRAPFPVNSSSTSTNSACFFTDNASSSPASTRARMGVAAASTRRPSAVILTA